MSAKGDATINRARSFLGQSFIGTNSSDKGQCVGLQNQVQLDTTGTLYTITPVWGAKDYMTAPNKRPDLMVQVWNNWDDPNQLPSVGDWMIWGASWGSGYGHIGCVESVDQNGFTCIEQNYVPNKVTRQQHNWTGIIGWVHIVDDAPGTPTPPAPSEPGQTTYTVQKDDNLWVIAEMYGITWPELYAANVATIGDNPDLIYPGQVLVIP